jgi:phage shock protein C
MMGLKRAKRDRWIMGVCGGIAHRYGWNSTVVRLVTIVLAIVIPGVSVIPTLLIYFLLERVMNSAEKPHWDADSSVISVLHRSPVFRISKPFLSKFITRSRGTPSLDATCRL